MARPLVTSFLRMDASDLPILTSLTPAQAMLEWPANRCSVGLLYEPETGLEIRWAEKAGDTRSQPVELATTAPYLGGTRRWFV